MKVIRGANRESAVGSGILSTQTITDSGSPPPHSVAERRSSPRTSMRRTQPPFFCAALSRYLPAHNQRLRSVRRVERALERLRLHTALLAGCFFERRLERARLAVELIRYR